ARARESVAGAKRRRLTRLGRREAVRLLSGGIRRGSREADRGDVRTATKERQRLSEDRSERLSASRLGLRRSQS
ncbi:hypothetical protein, partial [Halorubrum tebenquichense]|uniref:hypothetical protein n=1 Tax=Halorubrum tebenquichense TaxID=119434 RepID=UPI0019D379A0